MGRREGVREMGRSEGNGRREGVGWMREGWRGRWEGGGEKEICKGRCLQLNLVAY